MTQIMKTEDMNTAIRLLELEKKLDGGGLGGAMIVTKNEPELIDALNKIYAVTLDKTWQEIYDAVEAGRLVYLRDTNCYYSLFEIGKASIDDSYFVNFRSGKFNALAATDYPGYTYEQSVEPR